MKCGSLSLNATASSACPFKARLKCQKDSSYVVMEYTPHAKSCTFQRAQRPRLQALLQPGISTYADCYENSTRTSMRNNASMDFQMSMKREGVVDLNDMQAQKFIRAHKGDLPEQYFSEFLLLPDCFRKLRLSDPNGIYYLDTVETDWLAAFTQ